MLVLKVLTGHGTGHMLSQLTSQSRPYRQASVSGAEGVFFPLRGTPGEQQRVLRNELQCAFPAVRGED